MLKLRHIYFAALGLGLACAASADEQCYVSDDLLTYIHNPRYLLELAHRRHAEKSGHQHGVINDLKKQNQALNDQLTTAQKKSTRRRFSLTTHHYHAVVHVWQRCGRRWPVAAPYHFPPPI